MGGEKKLLNTPHKMPLLHVTRINKLYNPKRKESEACAKMTATDNSGFSLS